MSWCGSTRKTTRPRSTRWPSSSASRGRRLGSTCEHEASIPGGSYSSLRPSSWPSSCIRRDGPMHRSPASSACRRRGSGIGCTRRAYRRPSRTDGEDGTSDRQHLERTLTLRKSTTEHYAPLSDCLRMVTSRLSGQRYIRPIPSCFETIIDSFAISPRQCRR